MERRVRLHRRRINLSFDRWRQIRSRHPRPPPRPLPAAPGGNVRTIPHCIPIFEYGFTTDRLHSVPNRAVVEEIRTRLMVGLKRAADVSGYLVAPPVAGDPRGREMNMLDLLAQQGIAPSDALVEEGA
jgi:hypothetical protein